VTALWRIATNKQTNWDAITRKGFNRAQSSSTSSSA